MWPLLELSARLSSRFHISEGYPPGSAPLSHISSHYSFMPYRHAQFTFHLFHIMCTIDIQYSSHFTPHSITILHFYFILHHNSRPIHSQHIIFYSIHSFHIFKRINIYIIILIITYTSISTPSKYKLSYWFVPLLPLSKPTQHSYIKIISTTRL